MAKVITNKKRIRELLTLGVDEVLVKSDLEKKLISGKVLRVKHGVDPTSKDLHLGYGVVYHKLREFQELGHKIIFLIGGFTGRFGDPTDKDKSREMKNKKEVKDKSKNYLKQLARVLDVDKIEIRDNSEWYDKWSFEDGLKLISRFTVARMLERDMFQTRIKNEKEIYFHEPIYPMLQGWDSVELESDLTVIGTDQKFNELQARGLQESAGRLPQDIVTVPLLVGTDGKMKMSQSLGNYIGLDESPSEQFGKIMSIPDKLLLSYFELAARYKTEDLDRVKQELDQGKNPRDLKVELGKAIVAMYHSQNEADKAMQEFNKVFKDKALPDNIKEVALPKKAAEWFLYDLLVEFNLVESKNKAKEHIKSGAVKINNKKFKQWDMKLTEVSIKSGDIIQVGKRKFVKIK